MVEKSSKSRTSGIIKTIGPGILFAGAAIGGSHLVQSTKAGAIYGFGLIWAVVLANLFKYPFFEFSHRYTATTRESVIDGYARLGKSALWGFLAIALFSGVVNIAGVTAVTAALAGNLFSAALSPAAWTLIMSSICVGLLAAGHYPALDGVVKAVVALLAVSTAVAFFAAVLHGGNAAPGATAPPMWDLAGVTFLIALMGWMPAPIDVGVWPSLWSLERRKQTGHTPSLKEALVDFHIGYIGTFVLALFFLGLGALVMFGTGETPAVQGVPFANQLIQLYTKTLGGWSYYFIAVAAFTCMFSTTLTCFDGYTRAVHGAFCLAVGRKKAHREDVLYWVLMIFFMATTIVVVRWFASSMTNLVNFATIMAFLTAPVMALLNFRLIFSSHVPQEGKPGPWLRWLAYAGLVFLSGFAVFYVYQWLAAGR